MKLAFYDFRNGLGEWEWGTKGDRWTRYGGMAAQQLPDNNTLDFIRGAHFDVDLVMEK